MPTIPLVTAPERHWWERPLRIIQLNLTVPDAARDGAQMARRAHEYGANALLINAGGIYAFYPTDVPFHRRAPGLYGDLLGDAVRYCREHGLRVIARYDLIGLHRDAYEAHPEWFYRSHDGRPMVDKGLYMTCPNGAWWQERFFRLWDELAARGGVDGLFFNAWGHKEATREGVYLGPCHCPVCVRLFRERYGHDLPVRRDASDPAHWRNQEFRRATLDDIGRRIYRYVKERDPEVALFAGAGHRALATGQADCTEIELHCGSTSVPTGNRWRHAAGESCKLVASLGPGYASGINAVYCHVGPGRWRLSAAPPGWLGYTLAQTIANAGWPYCMLIGTLDTQEDRTALAALREIMTFARDHEARYGDLESAAGIGLLWSQRTATAAPGWTDTTDRYAKHFRGWYDLLTRRHHLFDVLSDTQLEGEGSGFPGQLSAAALRQRYGLLIVPNAARLDAAACATLDEYVGLGGNLVATGAPPLGERGLRSLGAAAHAAERTAVSNSYFRVRADDRRGAHALSGGALDEIDLLPVEGRVWHVAPRTQADAQLGLIPPEDYGAPEQTYFTLETDHPGILWHPHGPGTTAYLPWEPDRAWFETGSEALGALLDALVSRLAPPPAAAVEAPETVELT
ncbi:MAG TPA: alpha-amylase family protein, partial [Chloroflexota bacterium]|nr:alpha-amylase family protein [Chloroflexota bacterium]